MNKLIALCGLVMLSTATTSQEAINYLECNNQEVEVIITSTEQRYPVTYLADNSKMSAPAPKLVSRIVRETPVELAMDEIIYIEEEEVDLGFDTAEYLPENFDPYKQYVDLDAIEFIEEEESLDFGFETSEYLPENFNPYASPVEVMNIDYIEEGEDEFDLGFDTAQYLPEGFDPHEFYVDLAAIEYIEEEDELEFNFLIEDYLPEGFDPYVK